METFSLAGRYLASLILNSIKMHLETLCGDTKYEILLCKGQKRLCNEKGFAMYQSCDPAMHDHRCF